MCRALGLLPLLLSLLLVVPGRLEYVIEPKVEGEVTLWTGDGDGDVAFYRIPIVTPAPDGTLVALSEGRKRSSNDSGPKVLSVRRSVDGGKTWGPTGFKVDDAVIKDGLALGVVLTDEDTKTMMVIYSHCPHSCVRPTAYLIKSFDNGLSWGEPQNLTEQIGHLEFSGGPGYGIQKKHHPHVGRLIACGHRKLDNDGLICIHSDDHGITWRNGAEIPSVPYNKRKVYGDFCPDENQIVELKDGSLLISIRNQLFYHSHARIFARSHDGCNTAHLKEVYIAEKLIEPACAAGMLYVEEHDILLHSNPFDRTDRINMTLSWSYDRGVTWNDKDRLQIWPGPSGYSCLTLVPGRPGYVGLIYEKGDLGHRSSYEYISYTSIRLNRRWKN